MLRTRGNRSRGTRGLALKSEYHCASELARQPGVLAESFCYTAPSGVSRYVQHRGECPVDAFGTRLPGRDGCGARDEVGIPAGSLAERNRKHSTVSMNHVTSEDKRNAQPAFLYS